MNKKVLRSIFTFYGMPHPNISGDESSQELVMKFDEWLKILRMFDDDLERLFNSKLIQIKPVINEDVNYDINIYVDKRILNGEYEEYNKTFIKFIFTLYKEKVYTICNIYPINSSNNKEFDECRVYVKEYMIDELINVIKFIKNIKCKTIRIVLKVNYYKPIIDLTNSILYSKKFDNIIYQILNDEYAADFKKYIYANLNDSNISKVQIVDKNGYSYSKIF